ncbi:MAG: redoxin domain-containing protein [Phycisphaerae bacterium]|nr:redoxin domain-containing protein [Tepidisphaeraceae bacterium]
MVKLRTRTGRLVLSLSLALGASGVTPAWGEEPAKPDAPQTDAPAATPDPEKDGQKPAGAKPDVKPEPPKPKPRVKVQKIDGKELLKVDGADAPDHGAAVEKKKLVAKVSDDAKAELAKISAAYKALTALEVAGTLSADIKVGGQAQQERAQITGSFAAPNKFRHEVKDDVVVGSTGTQAYAYRPAKNDYKTADAPKDRVASDKFPSPMKDLLQMQNPALLCALLDDAGKFLEEDVAEVSKIADLKIDGKAFTQLTFKAPKESYTVSIDPATHLIRRVVLDMKQHIKEAGREDVEQFVLTFDYTSVQANGTPKAEAFAWAVPGGAKDQGAAETEGGEATALAGKAAPDFTLNGLDGKPVALKDQRGSVVILDFWATWCGPCLQSLPQLNKLHAELTKAGKPVKTYAIDLEESKEKVQPVAAKVCPDLHVLLDADSSVSEKYGVSGIPQTVVIGKDGKVKKVFVGGGQEAKIRAAVEKALKE